MSTDRELLELAAKAIGLEIKPTEVKNVTAQEDDRFIGYLTKPEQWPRGWFDPLTDDGDALRLAVDLRMSISYGLRENTVYVGTAETAPWREVALSEQDIPAATRRAIVRAAAEVGRAMLSNATAEDRAKLQGVLGTSTLIQDGGRNS